MSGLILHAGGHRVTLDQLAEIEAPPPEGRWYPLRHIDVLWCVKRTLSEFGFEVEREQLAIAKDGHRFFGTLDLATRLRENITLSVGVRNSTDRSFPLGFCAGNRVFCCDNLAFSAELLVKRKHTKFGQQRFSADIAESVPKLRAFRQQEAARIEEMVNRELTEVEADAFILRAFERGIILARDLGEVIREWRNPSFEEFKPRTAWSLFNCFTTVLGKGEKDTQNPHRYATTTMRLNALVSPYSVSV